MAFSKLTLTLAVALVVLVAWIDRAESGPMMVRPQRLTKLDFHGLNWVLFENMQITLYFIQLTLT